MSIGKVLDPKTLLKELEGLSPEEALKRFHELITAKFYKYYGRYESVSGHLFVEMFHHGDPANLEKGSVVYRRGETGKTELEEDLILPREVAIGKFRKLVDGGWDRVFEAVTEEDIAIGNAKREKSLSKARRDNILGIYYKGKNFFRLNQYGNVFSIEYGYDGRATRAEHEQTESAARTELQFALAEGYRRKGEEPAEDTSTSLLDPIGTLLGEHPILDEPEPEPEAAYEDDWTKLMD